MIQEILDKLQHDPSDAGAARRLLYESVIHVVRQVETHVFRHDRPLKTWLAEG